MSEPQTYKVTVYDVVNGDVVKVVWEATDDDIDKLEEQYGDDGSHMIEIEESS